MVYRSESNRGAFKVSNTVIYKRSEDIDSMRDCEVITVVTLPPPNRLIVTKAAN